MKRVVAIVIIMAMLTTLFVFSVYAAPAMGASISTSISSDDNNITAYAYAVYEEDVYQTSSGGSNLTLPSFMISIRIVNNTDKWVVKDNDQFKIRLNGNTAVGSPFECIEVDNCQITEISTSTGKVDFSIKGNNSFVLAPNEIYTLSFRFVNSAGFTTSPSLQFFNNQFLNSAYTIEELVSLPADELAYLSSINVDLHDLIDILAYTGSGYSDSGSNMITNTTTYQVPDKDLSVELRRYIYPYTIENIDFEIDASNDQLVNYQYYRYHIVLILINMNLGTKPYQVSYFSYINNVTPNITNDHLSISDVQITSDLYEQGILLNDGRIMLANAHSVGTSNNKLIPVGRNNTILSFDIYSPSKIASWPSLDLSSFYPSWAYTVNEYEPKNIYELLKDLYKSLTKNSSNDNTAEAQDMNDEIHDAEQVWYENNSEALEQVGLSNYRFSQSQSNGITQAVTQFQAVWNALGDWTNVYIFILILSISTYIIRHEPTTRVKQYRSSVAAERAERISYYGRKNAESRASNSTTLKSVIRRRK